ncbi:alpha/beta hydrolase [Microbacterium sp. zg.Y1090]|uniref:alpha/beta fold hydrolase n=1 Tax=Microbacterium wangruii TaxID=3049073 RepID=UPI00214D15E5|nr:MULTISPECIES: alpha/beta hydrolase [unclassified Microbacterium]MCR2818741.1 alpha/beta hydrolase [Microbacterium sp. zg.Y1090]WIM27060.1 alpha/beta hydrolase [Microbacterium sp. zg-Y1090]
MTSTTHKPTIVLVHGAWADGLSFAALTERLQRQGHTVLLSPNPLRGVAHDTKAVSDFLAQATTGAVILPAHSYGGIVISGAALGNPLVRALVYIDAYAPVDGESASSLSNERPGSLLNVPDPTTVFDFVVPAADATQGEYDSYIKRDRFHAIFADGIPSREAAVLAAGQSATALAALGTPFSGTPAWQSIPSWSVIGTADRVIPPAQLRAMASRAGSKTVEIDAPHLSMTAGPRRVGHVIEQAAASI